MTILNLSNAIYRKRCKIGGTLVLITNRKLHISFRLVSNSVTLNDLAWRNSRYHALFHWNLGALRKAVQFDNQNWTCSQWRRKHLKSGRAQMRRKKFVQCPHFFLVSPWQGTFWRCYKTVSLSHFHTPLGIISITLPSTTLRPVAEIWYRLSSML